MLDSSGRAIFGEGEWAAVKHGGRGVRGWKKLHLGVDSDGVIVGIGMHEHLHDVALLQVTRDLLARQQHVLALVSENGAACDKSHHFEFLALSQLDHCFQVWR